MRYAQLCPSSYVTVSDVSARKFICLCRGSASRAHHAAAAAAAPASRVYKGKVSSVKNRTSGRANVSKATRVTTQKTATEKNVTAAPKSRARQKQSDAYAELPSRRAGRNLKCVNPFKSKPNSLVVLPQL